MNDFVLTRSPVSISRSVACDQRELPWQSSRSFLIRHSVVRQEDFLFDPREIPSALLRRHCLADLEKVAKHHGLTSRPQPSALGQSASDFRRHVRCAGKQGPELHIVRVDLAAYIAAPWKVRGVKIGYALKGCVAQVE